MTLAACAAVTGVVAAQEPETAAPPGQGPHVTFNVDVNLVEVDVRVLDAAGNFARDLTKGDFEIVEDGVVQEIANFALIDIPVEQPEVPLFVTQPIEPDVATNRRPFDGRLYLLVLDDLHTSPARTGSVRAVAREFIETKLGANDRAAIVTTRGTSLDTQGFTDNQRILLDAVDNFIGQKLTSEALMNLSTAEVVDPNEPDARFAPGSDPVKLQRALNANAAMNTLRNASEFMANLHGRRKALIYVSEGIDYDVYDSFNNRESSRILQTSQNAMAAATRANVAIYSIDPRGLTSMGDDSGELSGGTDEVAMTSILREMQVAQDSLRTLSDGTGGFSAVNASDFGGAFDRIVSENSSYYMLGYYAANTRRDGRTRRIDVRLPNRGGLQAFARDSYIESRGDDQARQAAPALSAPSALVDAIRSPLPLAGLSMSATAVPFRGSNGKASVAVVVEASGNDLALRPDGDRHTGVFDVAVWAVDSQGRPGVSERMTTNLNLREESFQRVSQYGLRVLLRVEVTPGRYQFRVGALAPETGIRGSVFYDVDVPDFSKEPLAMSGVLLTSAMSSRALTAQPDSLLSEVLPASPTTQRVFPVNDQIAVLTEIYDNDSRPHEIDITTDLLTDTGELVFTTSESRSNSEFGGGPGGYGYVTRIPLAAFEPGLYVLRIQARSRLGASAPVKREVQFRIEG